MIAFVRRHVVVPVVALLRQGITPERIALSLACGTILSIFPVLGTTTVLCTAVALLWRLNLAAIQAANFAMTPLQLLLIIPFARIGERLLGDPAQPLSIGAGQEMIAQGAGQAVAVLWDAIVHAVVGWLVFGPIAIYLLYRALIPVLERAARRFRPRPAI